MLVGELDTRGTWAAWGALSCAAWLADVCDIDIATARTQVRVAQAMRQHPGLHAAMQSGVLREGPRPRPPPDRRQRDSTGSSWRCAPPRDGWGRRSPRGHAATKTPTTSTAAATTNGPCRGAPTPTAWSPSPPDSRHNTAAEIIAVVDQRVMAHRAPAGASLRQQRADALTTTVTHGNGSMTAEIVIHIRGDQPATLADGTPLSDHAVTSLLDDGFVSLLLCDTDRQPIDASPRRLCGSHNRARGRGPQ
ncbi:MAG: hypothetical protein JJE52_08395 [Acidimicrobiia bacterium]|nr:hypothetical protein [Acidimicrobiia bacterium]